MPNPTDVPEICDLILNGERYMFALTDDQRAAYSYPSMFVPRTATSDVLSDEQQDYWLYFTQKDWSLGEEQKYQGKDDDSARRFWRGKNVNLDTSGQVTINVAKSDVTFASAPKCAVGTPSTDLVWLCTTTNLYSCDSTGTLSDKGAHGLGVAPTNMATDGNNIYISSVAGGTVGIRRFNIGTPAFTTFSGTGVDSMCFTNNTLYSYIKSTGTLNNYAAGAEPVAPTTLFTWKDARGNADTTDSKIVAFAGKVVVFRKKAAPNGSEIWLYQDPAPSKVAEFTPDFVGQDAIAYNGTVFVIGSIATFEGPKNAILFYKDGATGTLWSSPGFQSGVTYPIAPFREGMLTVDQSGFGDIGQARLVYYNGNNGAFSTVLEGFSATIIACGNSFALMMDTSTTGRVWGPIGTNGYSTTAEVDSVRIDFGVSVPKILRGITVIFDSVLNGSVDIKASTDGGSYVTVQNNATSGVEYRFSTGSMIEGDFHKLVQVRIVLNRGNNGPTFLTPTLKRIMVRGMVVRATASGSAFKQRVYRLQLTGKDGEGHIEFYNGEKNPKDGKDMHTDLQTAATKTLPFSITDTMGTYTGIIEKLVVYVARKDEFIAEVTTREV